MHEFLLTAKENILFLLTCLGIFAVLVLIAWLDERFRAQNKRRLSSAKTISYIGIFSALAGVLMLVEFPLGFAPPFYKLDLSEIPVLICAFYLGPVSGVVCELLKVLVHLLLKGTTTAFVGDFANFAIGCSMVLPATMLYHRKKSRKTALLGLIISSLTMTVFGSLFNGIYLLPKFAQLYGMPLDAIIAMGTAVNGAITSVNTLVLFAVVPFNILKGVLVSIMTMLLYKRVEQLLH